MDEETERRRRPGRGCGARLRGTVQLGDASILGPSHGRCFGGATTGCPACRPPTCWTLPLLGRTASAACHWRYSADTRRRALDTGGRKRRAVTAVASALTWRRLQKLPAAGSHNGTATKPKARPCHGNRVDVRAAAATCSAAGSYNYSRLCRRSRRLCRRSRLRRRCRHPSFCGRTMRPRGAVSAFAIDVAMKDEAAAAKPPATAVGAATGRSLRTPQAAPTAPRMAPVRDAIGTTAARMGGPPKNAATLTDGRGVGSQGRHASPDQRFHGSAGAALHRGGRDSDDGARHLSHCLRPAGKYRGARRRKQPHVRPRGRGVHVRLRHRCPR